ncbi:MAG: hypothetical protein HUJ68_11860, partial [Clostridia bacterium]|nr:hypothetical protein [Clostridia bacterium]
NNEINKLYNSKNISEIHNEKFNVLIIAGVSANKQFANMNPEEDLLKIKDLYKDLQTVKAKQVVLISTIDIYNDDAYGKNRKIFEDLIWNHEGFEDVKILRLPGLFGPGLKKNVIYDLKNLIPSFIKKDKFEELAEKDQAIRKWYKFNSDKNIYEVVEKSKEVEKHFIDLGFTSLSFSNLESDFYWFNLKYISDEIGRLLVDKQHRYYKVIVTNDKAISNKEIIENKYQELFKSDSVVKYSQLKFDHYDALSVYNRNHTIEEIKDFINDTSC